MTTQPKRLKKSTIFSPGTPIPKYDYIYGNPLFELTRKRGRLRYKQL
ncbi:MAG: hypothetical protein ACE5I1_32835 [bacterium]